MQTSRLVEKIFVNSNAKVWKVEPDQIAQFGEFRAVLVANQNNSATQIKTPATSDKGGGKERRREKGEGKR